MKAAPPDRPDAQASCPPAAPTDRLFFAAFPDPDSAERLARFAVEINARANLRGAPVPAGRLLVVLAAVGHFHGLPEREVLAACDVAARVDRPAVEVAFDTADLFAGGRYALNGGATAGDLRGLCQELERLITARAPGPMRSLHTPHMTVVKHAKPRDLRRYVVPIRWTAREIVLVHGKLRRPDWAVLARWPLA